MINQIRATDEMKMSINRCPMLALIALLLAPLAALHAADAPPHSFDLQGNALEAQEASRTFRERPNLTVYLPDPAKSSGITLIVFPGGGYHGHDTPHHVEANASYFVPRGIAVIGVRYRVAAAQPRAEVTETTVSNALADAQQAVRLVRSHAAEWHLDPKRIGVLGYSAGSHLALTLACHFDLGDAQSPDPILRQSCRPDFMVALCPFPRTEQAADFHFDPQAPPTFIATAKDDKVAPSEFTVGIAESLRKLSVPVEVHFYPEGGHMAFHFDQNTEASYWPERFLPWLRALMSPTAQPASVPVQPNTWIKAEVDRPDAIYKVGEKAVFRVTVANDAPARVGEVSWALTLDGARTLGQGTTSLQSGTAEIEGTLNEPGVLQLKVTPSIGVEQLGTGLAGAAYDPFKIEPTAKLPADFQEFWNAQKASLSKIPLDPKITPVPQDDPTLELYEVSFENINALRSHGYLAKPKGATSLPIMISQPGMGVHPNGVKESRWVLGNAKLGFLALDMSAHDMPLERTPEDEARWKKFMGYPYIGSDDRTTYYYHQVFLGMVRAVDYMTSRPDWNRKVIISSGASQGGGLAIILAALDPRVNAVVAVAPALGEHTGLLFGRPDAAPNNLIMGPDRKTPDPKIVAATAYYDTCNFARFVKVPVLMSSGLIDTACPAMTVLSIYNTLTCPKQIDLVPLLGHNHSRSFDAMRNRFLIARAGIAEPSATPTSSMSLGAPIERK